MLSTQHMNYKNNKYSVILSGYASKHKSFKKKGTWN